jgi:phage terminase large subunit
MMLDKTRTLQIKTPRLFQPLLAPARYKGAWGGRGSGKSHFFAELLIDRCVQYRGTRAVCLREIQKDLKRSSKMLIEDKLRSMGVQSQFRVMDNLIETPGDGIIIFQGMQNHTAESIKSLEGFDIASFEEAQNMSAYSLGLLRPTIRKPNSELWFAWNPRTKRDPVDVLMRSPERPPDSVVIETHFWNNPWFPQVLRDEMEYDKRRDPDRYAHVWLGGYQQASEARVFRNWSIEEFETPGDARFFFGGDFGYSVDPTVAVRCWIKDRKLFVDQEVWKVGCETDDTPALLAGTDRNKPPRWPNRYGWKGIPEIMRWPLTLDSANPQNIAYLKARGFNVRPSIKGVGSVEEGINFLKSFDIVAHPRCPHVIDELSTFSWQMDKRTEEVLPVLADKKNHTIDSLRYAIELQRKPVGYLQEQTYYV